MENKTAKDMEQEENWLNFVWDGPLDPSIPL